MTDKEKAKAYDRILSMAKEFNFKGYIDEECLYDMFPQLRESEDEQSIDYWYQKYQAESRKCKKIKELADGMYEAAQSLTTDASRLHKAMDNYHQFIISTLNETK